MPLALSDWQLLSPSAGPPASIAAAATIAPTTFLTILTGSNTAIATITPPVPHAHMLALQFSTATGTAGVSASGNILTAKASVLGEVMLLVYNPSIAKYVPVG